MIGCVIEIYFKRIKYTYLLFRFEFSLIYVYCPYFVIIIIISTITKERSVCHFEVKNFLLSNLPRTT